MSKRGVWERFNSFIGGEKSDLPPHMIPDDSLLSAVNVVTDKAGRISKRGPIQPYMYNSIPGTLQQVGVSKITLAGQNPNLGYGVNSNGYYFFTLPEPPSRERTGSLVGPISFNSSGIPLVLGDSKWGPSFNSFGLCTFPLNNYNTVSPLVFLGSPNNVDAISSNVLSNSASITVTANNQEILCSTFLFTEDYVGKIVYVNNNSSGPPSTTKEYVGVITSVTGPHSFTVYPAPTQGFTSSANGALIVSPYWSIGGRLREGTLSTNVPASATFGCIHQNRIILLTAATSTWSGTLTTTPVPTQYNMISWSSQTGSPATAGNTGSDGILGMLYSGWPSAQNLTLDTTNVVGVVSLDANNLLVLCSDKTLLISGTLGSVLPGAGVNTSSFNIRTVSPEIGCVDAASIQRTPLGVVFAGRDGVYITDGASFSNITEGKIQNKWTIYDATNSYSSNKITGSAVLKDTHYVVFTEKGPHFICDLYNNFSWTEIVFENSVYQTSQEMDYVLTYPSGISSPDPLNDFISFMFDSNTNGEYLSASTRKFPSVLKNSGTQENPVYSLSSLPRPLAWTHPAGGAFRRACISDDGEMICYFDSISTSFGVGGLALYKRDLITGVWSVYSEVNGFASTGIYDSAVLAKATKDRVALLTSGTINVYRDVSGLTLEATLTPPVTPTQITISNNGDTIVVASPTANTNIGRLYVYKRIGTSWSLFATLAPSPAATGDFVGREGLSLSPDGSHIAAAKNSSPVTSDTIYTWVFTGSGYTSTGSYNVTNSDNFVGKGAITFNSNGTIMYVLDSTQRKLYKYVYGGGSSWSLNSSVFVPQALSDAEGPVLSGNGVTLYIAEPYAAYRGTANPAVYTRNKGFHVFNVGGNSATSPVFGIGVHDWSGSTEVYAPRLNDSLAVSTSDAIVLLDSILDVDNVIQTDAIGFNQLVDACTTTAYNAQIVTKSFALGDPTALKAYKTFMMTYAADARAASANPVQFRFAESLQPALDFSSPAYASRGDTSANTKSKPARIAIIPRPIDNGIAFGLNTTYAAADSANGQGQFKVYEIGLNAAPLRKGRIIQ